MTTGYLLNTYLLTPVENLEINKVAALSIADTVISGV